MSPSTSEESIGSPRESFDPFDENQTRSSVNVLEESFTGLVSGLKRLDNIRHSAAGGRKAEDSDRLRQATEGYCVQTKALLRRSIAATDVVVADMLRAKKDAHRHKAKSDQLERTVYKLDAMLKQNHNRQQRHPQARILLRKWILGQKRTLITAVLRCWFTCTRQDIHAREATERRIRNAHQYELARSSFTSWRRETTETKELENVQQYLPALPVDTSQAADPSHIAALEDEIVLLKAARDQLEADKAGLRVECERASARLREREVELRATEGEHSAPHLEAELVAERERSASLETRLMETVAKVAEFQALLEKNRKASSGDSLHLREEAGSIEGECVASGEGEACRQVPGVTLETEELRERVEQLQQQLKNAEESQRGSAFEDATSSGKITPEESSVVVMRESYEDMERQLVLLREEREKHARDLQDHEEERQRLKDELDTLRAEASCLGDANEELRATMGGMRASEAGRLAKLDDAKVQEVRVDRQRQMVTELQARLSEIQEKLDKSEAEGKKREEALTGAKDALTAKVMALEFQINSYEEEKGLRRSKKEMVEEELEKLKTLLEEARQESARQEYEISASRDEATTRAEEEKQELMQANLHARAEATHEEQMESLRVQLESIRNDHEKTIEEMSEGHIKEVEALTDTLESLEAKIREMTLAEEARAEISKKEGDDSRAMLEAKKEEHSREISSVRLELELMEKQLGEKKAELVTLSGELNALTASLRESEEKLVTEKAERAAQEERSRLVHEELDEVSELAMSLCRSFTTFLASRLTAKEMIARERISRLEEALEQLETERIQIEKERDTLLRRLDEAGDSSSQMEQLAKELDKVQAELDNARKENDQRRDEIETLRVEKQAISDDIWKQEVCLKEASEGREAAENALRKEREGGSLLLPSNMSTFNCAVETDRVSLEGQYQEAQARLEEVLKSQEEWKEKCHELSQELEDTKTALSATREQNVEQARELTHVGDSAVVLEEKLAEALTLHAQSSEEAADLKGKIDALASALDDKDVQKAGVLEELEKLRHVVEERDAAADSLQGQLQALRLSSEGAEARYNEKLGEARKEIDILRASAGDEKVLVAQIEDSRAQVTAYEERIAELTTQLEEAEREISQLNEELKVAEAERAEVQASSCERTEALKELEDARESKESIIRERDAEIARLKGLVSSAESASDELKSSLDGLRSRLRQAEEKEAEAEGKMVSLEAEREALQQSVVELKEAKQHLAKQARRGSEFESKYKALEASEELLAERERELDSREAHLADMEVNLPEKLSGNDVAGIPPLDEPIQQPDAEIQLRIAETEHELLMKLEDTEKGLAEERTASNLLTARIQELEAKEKSLAEQLELMTIDREEFERRSHQVELLITEREALIARIERAEAACTDVHMAKQPPLAETAAYPEMELKVEGALPAPASNEFVPTINTLAFCSTNLSPYITVSPNGMEAEYDCGDAAKDEVMCGVVMTDRPLPYNSSFGYYMEVTIIAGASTSLKYSDGLTLGVTTTPPGEVRSGSDAPSSCDEIPETWAVGFDGQIWDPITNDWSACGWCGKDLKAGQKVGLLVSKSPVDQLFIIVDGEVVVEGPKNIPTGKELYGVVDLIGSTAAVLLSNPESTPLPPAALELVPKSRFHPGGPKVAALHSDSLLAKRGKSRNESKRNMSSSVAGGSVSGERVAFEMPSAHGSQSFIAPSVSSVGSKFALPSRKATSKHHSSSAHSEGFAEFAERVHQMARRSFPDRIRNELTWHKRYQQEKGKGCALTKPTLSNMAGVEADQGSPRRVDLYARILDLEMRAHQWRVREHLALKRRGEAVNHCKGKDGGRGSTERSVERSFAAQLFTEAFSRSQLAANDEGFQYPAEEILVEAAKLMEIHLTPHETRTLESCIAYNASAPMTCEELNALFKEVRRRYGSPDYDKLARLHLRCVIPFEISKCQKLEEASRLAAQQLRDCKGPNIDDNGITPAPAVIDNLVTNINEASERLARRRARLDKVGTAALGVRQRPVEEEHYEEMAYTSRNYGS
ncbi:3-dehydrosphinganine reductase [Perkinsus chesapeaki]|uniref:3-dehydrosphinganine reductase n=1 Tax=Perkinsus chesapeaki TaxID=330153 RepID=A0A7J6MNY5_PERCH|nr:3-dehydrosphinganine reductase [Perkinsus chesapeaki]